mmetsp:Transcript_2122/g.5229  ORF Transcript_2122/g.5229 Transcript_2122/m.5229 type:complete len:311 (+) Transcript_2122:154-1086(+)|eukprot:CAMPEP_0117556658 /NCGR_PEP_ID=MMETSP0784-20121206/51922_1 /TAXON_ID=39447 /ORGANISM="" /LENGTH=310 /DNA_ID=CAMNT_0005353939 /DNA_START=118 /DNA_END=1050 /DNA_ORIENTATION=+
MLASFLAFGFQKGLPQEYDDTERAPSPETRRLLDEVGRGGPRRDRTFQFARMRAGAQASRPEELGSPCGERSGCMLEYASLSRPDSGANDAACTSTSDASGGDASLMAELHSIHQSASSAHTSLASKLAQHNGLRQFSIDFADRAPPLELRMLVPELVLSIEGLLRSLEQLVTRLQKLEASPASRCGRLQAALEQYVTGALNTARQTFEQQQLDMQARAAISPLFSPVLTPALGKRFAPLMVSSSASTLYPWSPKSTFAECENIELPTTSLKLGLETPDGLASDELDIEVFVAKLHARWPPRVIDEGIKL